MADVYSYSGHKLPAPPELPEGCTHAVIYYDTEDSVYYLFCSSERIVYNENNVPQLPATTSWGGYACRAGGTYWFSATFTPEGDVENPDYYLLDQVLLWTNTDICQKDTDTVVLAATTPLQYPTITSISSSKKYTLGDEPEALTCEASVVDGVLSYQWYHGEETVGDGNSYTPDVSTVGSESYHCIVTNTVSGTELTTTSRTITITVEEEVEKFPIVGYVSGLVARMCSRRTEIPEGSAAVPTAYLYNGIRLPALPEWDRGVYPYVNIFKRTDAFITYDMYVAVADSKEMTVDSDGSAELLTEGKLYCFTRESGEWSDWAELAGTMPNSKLLWTNYDTYVYGSPDTLYMAASDPVPVYE